MTWRGVFGVLVLGAALTSGCRTQEAQAPPSGYDEAEDQEVDPEAAPDDEAVVDDTDVASPTEDAEEGEDDTSVEERLAVETVQSHLREEPEAEQSPLEFAVVQQGPNQRWVMGVVNRSDRVARLIGDPRLLSFEVEVPGKRKTVTCKLPESLRPTHAGRRYRVWLGPGQGVVKSFDPRLYCFASSGQHVLVPGAIVTPRFGWPEKVKTVWKRGKKETVKLEQSEPFVASLYPMREAPQPPPEPEGVEASDEADASDEDEPESPPETLRLKELSAPPIALGSDYKEWSSVGIQREVHTRSPIVIDMKQGSDAHSQMSATVAITLKNRSKRAQYVYFRRELLSFEVMGPGGLTTCDPQPDTRAPDRQAFLLLSPGRSMTITSRLVEMCPKGTFARPGFYLVHARFETNENGEEYGLDAYVGRVATEHPANVRIRSGELDPSDQQPMRPLQILE